MLTVKRTQVHDGRTTRTALGGLAALLLVAGPLAPDEARAVEKGHFYSKLFFGQWTATEIFDENGDRVSMGPFAKSTFRSLALEAFYGVSTRFNPGLELHLDYSRFESNVENLPGGGGPGYFKQWRTALTDLRLQAEYYFASFPKMISLLAGWQVPLGYEEDEDPWIGTGAQAVFAQVRAKRFFEKARFDIELDVEATRFMQTTSRVEAGTVIVPVDLFVNFYPSFETWTIFTGTGFAWNEEWWYLKGDLGVKYKLTPSLIIEAIGSYWFAGENTGAGYTIGGGISYGYRDFPF